MKKDVKWFTGLFYILISQGNLLCYVQTFEIGMWGFIDSENNYEKGPSPNSHIHKLST
jgi:hypothetical protein